MPDANIHQGQPVLRRGVPLAEAKAAAVLIHGRGSNALNILTLAEAFETPDVAYLAPDAAGGVWYPHRFIVPRIANEPYLSSTLATVGLVLGEIAAAGIPAEKTVLVGFSQGACVALEYAARHTRRYGGVIAFSGGLIGADDELIGYEDRLDETPVFIGCSDTDFHIPAARVHQSADIMASLGASVTKRIYAGMGHIINDDEIAAAQHMLRALTA